MRKWCILALLILTLSSVSGCVIVDALLSDIGGYDLSACSSWTGFQVCSQLVLDNLDKIDQ